jgi:polar amino acid transport system ATP-binding protein
MITVQNLTKQYGSNIILNQLNFQIQPGEIVGLIGQSGCGKSTLLRCIHGLERNYLGEIKLEGKTGFIFQQFHLFPHMNILKNITYAPIKVLKQDPIDANENAKYLLNRIGLKDKYHAMPRQLSGGQMQRVAIVRALAMQPEILLLDEPTSSLDPLLIQDLAALILDLQKQKLTILISSHEINFLKQVSNRTLCIEHGCITEGDPHQFFYQNKNQY